MDIRQLEAQISGIPHGQKKQYIERIAAAHGVSTDTIYRELRRARGKQKQVKREKDIPEEYIALVAQIKAKSKSMGAGTPRELSTERCISLLEQMGKVPKNLLTASTVNRRLIELGFRDPKPVQRYEPEYVNQSHQLDFSRSKYFELLDYDKGMDDYILICNQRSYVTKQDDGKKLRLWVAGYVEEKSRKNLWRYFAAAGENTLMGLEFLQFAYDQRDGEPLFYPPDIIRSDNGSFMKSREAEYLLKSMKTEWQPITPSNSKSLGKTERRWRTLFNGWELETALRIGDKNTIYLREFNELVLAECQRMLELPHPRIKDRSVGFVYQTGLQAHPPRVMDVDTFRHACRVFERKVGVDRIVTVENTELRAPAQYVGQRIRVYRNIDGDYLGESIAEKTERFKLEQFSAATMGDFHGVPDSAQETALKQYQASDLAHKMPKPDATVQRADLPSNVRMMPVRPQQDTAQGPFAQAKPDEQSSDSFKNRSMAREYIGRQLGVSYSDVAEIFDELLKVSLDRDIIDGLIADVRTQRMASNG